MTTTNKTARRKTNSVKTKVTNTDPSESLTMQFKELRMPTFRDQFAAVASQAEAEKLSYLDYLSQLTTLECQARRQGRIKRLMTRSSLPAGKTWSSFDFNRLPMNVRRQLETLRDGTFLDRRENILLFGKPGSGKPQPPQYPAGHRGMRGRNHRYRSEAPAVRQNIPAFRACDAAGTRAALPR